MVAPSDRPRASPAVFGERWFGTWAWPKEPGHEREIGLDVSVSLRPSRRRWPVCAEVEGLLSVEAWFDREPIQGVVELARVERGLCLRYRLAHASTEIVLARRLDPRDPYGSLTVLVGTIRLGEGEARTLLRADPRQR
ncbi:MAG: hypothetical protein U0414_40970 [Polyangiaceae bacterium]